MIARNLHLLTFKEVVGAERGMKARFLDCYVGPSSAIDGGAGEKNH
jgi:hypothetical protein